MSDAVDRWVYWDNRLWLMNTSVDNPTLSYIFDASGTPVTTGKLPNLQDRVNRLFTAPDALGNEIIYASTINGLWAFDAANERFLKTRIPQIGNVGAGRAVHWNGLIYYAAGIVILEYNPQTGNVRSIGLDNDDGLPDEPFD